MKAPSVWKGKSGKETPKLLKEWKLDSDIVLAFQLESINLTRISKHVWKVWIQFGLHCNYQEIFKSMKLSRKWDSHGEIELLHSLGALHPPRGPTSEAWHNQIYNIHNLSTRNLQQSIYQNTLDWTRKDG